MIANIKSIARRIVSFFKLLPEEMFWIKRCMRYNGIDKSREADLHSLLVVSHVLEKGITMPNRRLGFGQERVRQVLVHCKQCVETWGTGSREVQSTLNDLYEYAKIHKENNFELPKDIVEGIASLMSYRIDETDINSYQFTSESFFKHCKTFTDFANSRHTSRHYSKEPVKIDRIIKCIKLAQTAPSACNRQSIKVKIIASDQGKKTVLKYQNGSRGFGQDADKFLLVTAEQSAWDVRQQKSAFIDAGIFTMNLLYALHEEKICACTLNAHIYHDQIKFFYKEIGLKESEYPVVFISIGNAPDQFIVARSERINTENIYEVL